jgi:hypothetical protein
MLSVNLSLAFAQSNAVYSLPKTVLKIDVTATKIVETPGQFNQYAVRYLATNKVITEENTHYEIKSICVTPLTKPNPAQTFSSASVGKKTPHLHISVDENGILTGLNNPIVNEQKTPPTVANVAPTYSETGRLLPLTEEYMLAGSTAKLAEGAAKQIYRIREGRLALLLGETEHVPSGAAMKSALTKLDKLEEQLTQLFTGTIVTSTETKTFYFDPDQSVVNQVIFRLSAISGLVPPEDLSGSPYYVRLNIENQTDSINNNVQNANNRPFDYVPYILTATGIVSIDDGKNTLHTGNYDFPQFGKPIKLNLNNLTKTTKKVRIDNVSGRLLGIE